MICLRLKGASALSGLSYVIAGPVAITSIPGAVLPWITAVNDTDIHVDNLTWSRSSSKCESGKK